MEKKIIDHPGNIVYHNQPVADFEEQETEDMQDLKDFVKWFKKNVKRELTFEEKLQVMYWAFRNWEKKNKRFAVVLNQYGKYEPFTCYKPTPLGLFINVMTISGEELLPTNGVLFFNSKSERDKFLKNNRDESIFDEQDWGYTENYE